MKEHLKRTTMMLLCIMTMIAPAGGAAAVYATDSSQTYRFDLSAGGGSSQYEVKTGENIDVGVTLTRTDSGASDSMTVYAAQYDLLFDTRYFTLDTSSLSSGGTSGVQTFATDMDKNGAWSGYKKVTAAIVNASGAELKNGCPFMRLTLTALKAGETELIPYSGIVSISTGRDTYQSEAAGIKVIIKSESDEDTGNNGGASGGGDNTGNGSGNSGGSDNGTAPSPETEFSNFTDMGSHWSRSYVEYAVGKGYFSGVTKTQFAPDRSMTRGMLVTVLWRMENSPAASGGAEFSDVKADMWYANAVKWAAANGIANGAGNGRFMPDDPVTREQLMQMIRNYAKYKGADTTNAASLDSFSDSAAVSSWAKEAFGWGIASGMISGTGNNSLSPKGVATRAQVAKILTEFDKNILHAA